jgi:predicted enzyme related to lactoylglutathione lyase
VQKIVRCFNGDAKISSLGVLVVLYANDFNQKFESMTKADGETSKPVFQFSGGRRFHFRDPNGSELAL